MKTIVHISYSKDILQRERVAEGEVLAALHSSGVGMIEDAVVLETDGSFSIIHDLSSSRASALKDVKGCDRAVPSSARSR